VFCAVPTAAPDLKSGRVLAFKSVALSPNLVIHLRMPSHLALAAVMLLGVRSADTGWERASLFWRAGLKVFLVVWELWLRFHHRDA
jgi:hypothetical protein